MAAQHTLGTALHVHGQFLHDEGFGCVLHHHPSGVSPLQPSHNHVEVPALILELNGAPMVYIHSDTLNCPPLASLYTGSFTVEGSHAHHFDMHIE